MDLLGCSNDEGKGACADTTCLRGKRVTANELPRTEWLIKIYKGEGVGGIQDHRRRKRPQYQQRGMSNSNRPFFALLR
jgi:hypothetical protein